MEGHEKKEQNNSLDSICIVNNPDACRGTGDKYQRTRASVSNNPNIRVLLVHYNFYPVWAEDSKKAVRMLLRMID